MSKPDRFERAYDKMPKWFDSDSNKQEVINLLRREHRAVVRLANSYQKAASDQRLWDLFINQLKRRAQ